MYLHTKLHALKSLESDKQTEILSVIAVLKAEKTVKFTLVLDHGYIWKYCRYDRFPVYTKT